VTPYPFLLFVPNMQSMKVDAKPRPSLLSWFKNRSVSHQPRVQIFPLSVCLFMVSWDYFWILWLSKGYSEWSSGYWEVSWVPASRADESWY